MVNNHNLTALSRMTATTPLPCSLSVTDACFSAASKMKAVATPLYSHITAKDNGTAPSLEKSQ